jgi:hypothetical protein
MVESLWVVSGVSNAVEKADFRVGCVITLWTCFQGTIINTAHQYIKPSLFQHLSPHIVVLAKPMSLIPVTALHKSEEESCWLNNPELGAGCGGSYL